MKVINSEQELIDHIFSLPDPDYYLGNPKEMWCNRVIDSFTTPETRFLSNYWPVSIEFEGMMYPSVENAYQAGKTLSMAGRKLFTIGGPGRAKKLGNSVKLRKDWEYVKLPIMTALVTQKFMENPDLGELLKQTWPAELIEGNWWKDTFWGICNGEGQNYLGKILMNTRSVLIAQEDDQMT
jgi:ribA/ribD-fused uncharacterized protein